MQSWFETGPLGALLVVVLVVVLLGRGIWRIWRPGVPVPWPQVAGLASLTGIAVQNLSGFSARIYPIAVLLAVAVAAVLSGWMRQSAAPRLWVRRGRAITLGLVLVGVFFLLTLRNLHLQLALASARWHLAQNRVLTADSLMHSVLLFNADNAEVHYVLAQVHEANGNLPAAQQEAALAAGLNPHEALFWRYRGHLAAKVGGPEDQLPFLERAVALDPASEQFRLEVANLLIRLGRPRDALAHLDAALATSPGFHKVYTGYQEVENLRKAVQVHLDTGLPLTLPSALATGSMQPAVDPDTVVDGSMLPVTVTSHGQWASAAAGFADGTGLPLRSIPAVASAGQVWPPPAPVYDTASGSAGGDAGGIGNPAEGGEMLPPTPPASAADDPDRILRPPPQPPSRGGIDLGP